jgi:hypothetical protein
MRILPLGYKDGVINDRSEPAGVAMFFEVDDETLSIIESDPNYFYDQTLVDSCFRQKGRNAHLYLLVGTGDVRDVIKNLRWMMNEYDSVSWWTREHKKFYKRSALCFA